MIIKQQHLSRQHNLVNAGSESLDTVLFHEKALKSSLSTERCFPSRSGTGLRLQVLRDLTSDQMMSSFAYSFILNLSCFQYTRSELFVEADKNMIQPRRGDLS